jgi:IS30 family transposase
VSRHFRHAEKFPEPTLFFSLSTDNDKSFAFHELLEGITETKTYFTRPAAPYEKGSIENLNKGIRVFYPKKTDFSKVTQEDLEQVAVILRNTPMKVLGWKTPQEAFIIYELLPVSLDENWNLAFLLIL